MSKVDMARALVNQRLAVAAEEIFGLFERTIAEYEEELCRSKEKNERQQKLLDAVLNSEVRLHRADIQQLLVVKEEVPPEQQEWSPSLDQEDPPEPPHIKEEQEELWTSQEGEQLQGLEEADITKFLSTPVPVKSEDDEEKPQSSQLHQRQTEQKCVSPRSSQLSRGKKTLKLHLAVHTGEKRFSCSVCEKRFKRKQHLTLHMANHRGEKRFCCSVCDQRFTWPYQLTKHKRVCPQSSQLHKTEQNREAEPGASSSTEQMETGADGEDCGGPEPARNSQPDTHLQPETEDSEDWNDTIEHESSVHLSKCVSPQSSQLQHQDKTEDSSDTEHSDDWSKDIREPPSGSKSLKNNEVSKSGVICNTNENPLSCSLCGKVFREKGNLRQHMAVHWEKQFSCSVCEKRFNRKEHLTRHVAIHTGQKPFKCSVCEKAFTLKGSLTLHMALHSGEKRFSCSVCEKGFKRKAYLTQHMAIHTGQKPFKCSVCEKSFKGKMNLRQHMFVHSDEKRFSCSVCDQRFTWPFQIRKHKLVCPQSSQLHKTEQNREAEPGTSSSTQQMETGADGEDYGGPEPARNSHPDPHLQPVTEDSEDWNDTTEHETSVHLSKCVSPQSSQLHQQDKTEDSSDTEHSDDWSEDIREPPSGSKSLKNNEVSPSGVRCNTKGNPLSCSLCGKAFRGKGNLRQHMAVHSGEKRFSCSVCEKRFKRKGEIKVHMTVHTGEKRFSCSVCEKRFNRKEHLTQHMANHRGEKTFCCSDCDQRFTWHSQLRRHKLVCLQSSQLHQTEQNREAEPGTGSSTEQMETGADGEDCGGPEPARNSHPDPHLHPETEDSEDWSDTTEHESSVNLSRKPFSYSKCGSTQAESHKCVSPRSSQLSRGKKTLKLHMAVHTGEKRFSCSVCEKRFKRKGDMNVHMAVHTGEKRFSCSVCDQRFTWRHQLAKHKLVCPQSSQLHPTEQNREAEPGASSSTEQMETGADGEDCGGLRSLNNNEVSTSGVGCVTEENPLKCSLSDKALKWKIHLRQEMAVHTEKKRFSCSVCERSFNRKEHLTRHMAVHTGDEAFQCSVCAKGFTHKGSLKLHMVIHSAEKPFQCSVCERAFKRKAYLTLHMANHQWRF